MNLELESSPTLPPSAQDDLRAMQLREEAEELAFEESLMKMTQPERAKYQSMTLRPIERIICRMYAVGVPPIEIAAQVGMTPPSVRAVLRKESAKAFLATLYAELDEELRSLWGLTVDKIRRGLLNADPQVYLSAAALYGKFAGKFSQKLVVQTSAEDVVRQMMEGDYTSVGSSTEASGREAVSDPEQEG